MVSYSKVNGETKGDNLLFEAPTGSSSAENIELQPMSTKPYDTHDSQQLLPSFDEDDDFLNDDEHDDNDEYTHNTLTDVEQGQEISNVGTSSNCVNPQDSNVDSSSHITPTSRAKMAIDSIRRNFNFLDKVFNKNGYERVGQNNGSGSQNDGVFNNLSAKPDTQPQVESDKPPTYDEASQDQTPPYWENSVLAPGFGEEIFVDGLPVGNIINFAWNLLVSSSFQFVGFLLTYLLHTSHAAKQGSRAGLGFTFITYGYTMIPKSVKFHDSDHVINEYKIEPNSPNDYSESLNFGDKIEGSLDHYNSNLSGGVDPLSESSGTIQGDKHLTIIGFGVIIFGAFVILKALLNYHRAKKMEQIILQPPSSTVVTPEEQV